MPKNENLHAARRAKKDEFYTQLSDIENELQFYTEHFSGRVVLCNCDDPMRSNFHRYFRVNFLRLGLRELITTHKSEGGSYAVILTKEMVLRNPGLILLGDSESPHQNIFLKNPKKIPLKQGGDFRSDECVKFLQKSDIVVTNPPFSLFREFIKLIMCYKKKLLIIGNINCVIYNDVFPHIKNNALWLGPSITSGDRKFFVPETYPLDAAGCGVDESGRRFVRVKGVRWLTNLEHKKRSEILKSTHFYHKNPQKYHQYDNFPAINVDKTSEIPLDFPGIMGVPITFLDKYNPEQFEILGNMHSSGINEFNFGLPYIKGKVVYARVLIRNKMV